MPNINQKLHDAVVHGDIKRTIECLNLGADPFTTFLQDNIGQPILATAAMALCDSEIVDAILTHAKSKFDLSQPVPAFRTPNAIAQNLTTINWLQAAAIYSQPEIAARFKKYQRKNFPNCSISTILNQKFYHPLIDEDIYKNEGKKVKLLKETTLASLRCYFFSNAIIAGAFKVKCGDYQKAEKFAQEWFFLPPTQPLKEVIEESCVFVLSFEDNFKFLDENELERTDCDHNGRNLYRLRELLVLASSDIKVYRHKIEPFLQFGGIKLLSEPEIKPEGIYYKKAELVNGCNAHPIICGIILSWNEIINSIEPRHNSNENLHAIKQLDQRLTKVESTTQQIIDDLNALSEHQFNLAVRNLEAYPKYKYMFRQIHSELESYIRQKGDATLKIFSTQPSECWQMAQGAINVFSVGAAFIPAPFVSILPAIASQGLQMLIKHDNTQRNTAILKTGLELELSPYSMATFVAAHLVAETMRVFKDQPMPEKLTETLLRKVESQLLKLGKHSTLKFSEPKDALAFMCITAFETIEAKKPAPRTPEKIQPISGFTPARDLQRSSPACYTPNSTVSYSTSSRRSHEEGLPQLTDSPRSHGTPISHVSAVPTSKAGCCTIM